MSSCPTGVEGRKEVLGRHESNLSLDGLTSMGCIMCYSHVATVSRSRDAVQQENIDYMMMRHELNRERAKFTYIQTFIDNP